MSLLLYACFPDESKLSWDGGGMLLKTVFPTLSILSLISSDQGTASLGEASEP